MTVVRQLKQDRWVAGGGGEGVHVNGQEGDGEGKGGSFMGEALPSGD